MSEILAIRKETSRTTKLVLAVVAWVLVVLIWALISRWELLSRYVFPTPGEVLRAFGPLFSERGLLPNVYASWLRIGQAFLWCAVIAIPLGIGHAGGDTVEHRTISDSALTMRMRAEKELCVAYVGVRAPY